MGLKAGTLGLKSMYSVTELFRPSHKILQMLCTCIVRSAVGSSKHSYPEGWIVLCRNQESVSEGGQYFKWELSWQCPEGTFMELGSLCFLHFFFFKQNEEVLRLGVLVKGIIEKAWKLIKLEQVFLENMAKNILFMPTVVYVRSTHSENNNSDTLKKVLLKIFPLPICIYTARENSSGLWNGDPCPYLSEVWGW